MAYYLIDFENVHSQGLAGADTLSEDDRIYIFYTNNSNSLTFDAMNTLIASKAQVQLFHVGCGGRNALDFQLSSFTGYIIAKEEKADIRIISKDNGFGFLKTFWKQNFDTDAELRIFPSIMTAASYTVTSELPVIQTEPLAIMTEAADIAEDEVICEAEPVCDDIITEGVTETTEQDVTAETAAEEKAEAAPKKKKDRKKKAAADTPKQELSLLDMVKAAGITDDEQAEKVCALITDTKDKQQLYRSITKSFGMETGLRFYKALRPEYTNMRSVIKGK